MLEGIGGALRQSIQRAGIVKQIEAVTICDLWEEVVCDCFGSQIKQQSQAVYFKKGVLVVAVLNAVLAQEFKFKETELIKLLNQKKCGIVKKIRFEI